MITLDKERIFKISLAFMRIKGEPDRFLSASLETAYHELLKTADLRHVLIPSDKSIDSLPGDSIKKHLKKDGTETLQTVKVKPKREIRLLDLSGT